MRRPTRLGLALVAVLLVLLGAYTAYWWIVATRISEGVTAWAQTERAEKVDISWQEVGVTGFPFFWRVTLDHAVLRDGRLTPSPELRIPALSATARPWGFGSWELVAPEGLSAHLAGGGERPPLQAAVQTAIGMLAVDPQAGSNLWLNLRDISVEAGTKVPISSADAWVILPPRPPGSHTAPALGIALDLRQVQLPSMTSVLNDMIEELAFGITVKGAVPSGKLTEALAEWRDKGGTLELDNLYLDWGGVGANASGTLALDRELQPVGGVSGAIAGYDKILIGLVQSGRMRADAAGLARLALAVLARAGPDGKPEIKTAFTIQNGEMFLGPAKLGKAPHFIWE
jgi:hypothetical protein